MGDVVFLPGCKFRDKVMGHHHPDEDDQQGGDDEHGDRAPPHKDNLTKKAKISDILNFDKIFTLLMVYFDATLTLLRG